MTPSFRIDDGDLALLGEKAVTGDGEASLALPTLNVDLGDSAAEAAPTPIGMGSVINHTRRRSPTADAWAFRGQNFTARGHCHA